MVNEESGVGTGAASDKEGMMYHVGTENLYLIPTAEVPLTNMYRNTILPNADFSIKSLDIRHVLEGKPGAMVKT